jgi:hypothetical protein
VLNGPIQPFTAGLAWRSGAPVAEFRNAGADARPAGQPDPDLVIRTSGEQRVSNFLLWQCVGSELYFCDAYWPAFREIDFLRALRSYSAARLREEADRKSA